MNIRQLTQVLLWASLTISTQAAPAGGLVTQQDKLNYAVGHQVGGDFKAHGVELKGEALLQGVKDAINGDAPQLSQEDMEKVLVDFKTRIEAHQHVEIKKMVTSTAQGDIAQGRAFLAENAKKPGVKVLPSGLQYKVLQTSQNQQTGSPKADSKVTINYQGRLMNGRLFTTSYQDGKASPQTYALTDLVPGVQEGLKTMKRGDKWQLFVPSELSVPRGKGPMELRPMILEVELVDYK